MNSLSRPHPRPWPGLAVGALLLAVPAAPVAALDCPPAGMTSTVTSPSDGATYMSGSIVYATSTRSAPAPGWIWYNTKPDLALEYILPDGSEQAVDGLSAVTVIDATHFSFQIDTTHLAPGPYELEYQDEVANVPLVSCDVTQIVNLTFGDPLTARRMPAEKLKQLCTRDSVHLLSSTSPLTGNESFSIPITSWDYRGTTFPFSVSYNSLSLVDPWMTGTDVNTPAVPNFAGLSERNSKWGQPYAQWVDLWTDETGAPWAVWHQGSGALPFPTAGGHLVSPDSYHAIASGGSATTSYPCNNMSPQPSVTVPYGWFTITDANGTQYQFNQPQPGTGTHLFWTTTNCTALPHYLLSRIQDRWGRAVNMTWSNVTFGTTTEPRVTAVKDDSGSGLTLAYSSANGLLQTVADPQGRTHTLGYTAVPDETVPTPVNRQKLTSVTIKGPGSPNRTARTWTFAYQIPGDTMSQAYGLTYTGDLVVQKTEPDGLVSNYSYEAVSLGNSPTSRNRQSPHDWDGRVSSISWPDGSEGGQTVTYVITRTLNSPTQATLTYPSSPGVPLSVQYNYTAGNDVASVTDLATSRTWAYTYDSQGYHNLTSSRSPLEATGNPLVQYTPTFDSSGHISQVVEQVLQDGTGNLGDPVTTLFNALNEPTQITASARSGSGNVDQVTQLHYDNDGTLTTGNLTKILAAYGTSLQQESDLTYGGTPGASGLPDTVKNAVGAVSTFGYDSPSGRLLTAASPQNLLVPTTNPDHAASVTVLQYNTDGLPSLVQDPLGHQEAITYNAQSMGSANLVITVTHNGDGSARTLTLDPLGRILQVVDENGVKTVWTYNPRGQVKTITRAVGQPEQTVTLFNYDCRGDLYRIDPPSGGVGRTLFMYLRYKQDGTFDTTLSPNGTYEGQVCRINYADGTNEYFGYNLAGELAWHRKADGTIVTIATRDALHRITQVNYPASQGNSAFNVTTAYDEFGRITSTGDATGTTMAVYDVLNRPTAVTPPSLQKALTYSYTPDTTNQRWTTTVNVAGVGNYLYQEDTKGRLSTLVNPFNRPFSLGYDPDGKNTTVSFPNGVTETRMYSPRDWLTQIQISQLNSATRDTFNYLYYNAQSLYDPTGHLQQEVDAGSRTHAFFYDHRYELVQETHPDFGTYSYSYDANGNRTSKTSSLGTDYYGVDANNKLLWVNRGTNAAPTSGQTNPYTLFAYDANGNMTSRERRYDGSMLRSLSILWDGDDRLRVVNEGSTNRITASYDGGGMRASKTENWPGATLTHNYSWGPEGLVYDSNASTIYTPGFGQQQNGVDRYMDADWLGSTRYMSDGANGNSFPSMLRFDAFGNRSATGGTDAYDPSDLQFAGGLGYQTEFASTTEPGAGLQYLEQRYYDPAVGRFIGQDPIGFGGGLNLYGYCGNDPVNGADPTGTLGLGKFAFGTVAGAGLGLLVTGGDPIGAVAGAALLTGHLSYAESGDFWLAVADGASSGLLVSGVGELFALGSVGLAYHFGEFEAELPGVECGAATAASSAPLPAVTSPSATRLAQDLAVDPVPPLVKALNRLIGPNAAQNSQLQADIARLQAEGATDFRVNQQQVNINGVRVGIGRPDLQYTLYNARNYIEYDTDPANGLAHQQRLLANDPAGRVILKTIK